MDKTISQNTTYTPEMIWAMFAETREMFQETDRKFQETDRQFEKTRKEREAASRETDRKIKQVSDMVGKLGNRWGDFLEGLIEPGIYELFAEYGIIVHNKYSNVREFKDDKPFYEIDLLVFDDKYVILVEMKSRLTIEHIEEHITRLEKFQQYPPKNFNLKGKIALGAIAGISVEAEVVELAQQNGLFILVQKSNLVEIVNPKEFTPKEWKLP